MLLEHATVNETEAFDIPPDKGNMGLYIPFLFISNQFISK